METFNTTKTYSYSDLIREISIMIVVILIFYAVALLWFPKGVTRFTHIFLVVLLLKDFFVKASRRRLQRLTFDTNSNEIVVLFKSLFSDVKQIRLPFERARLIVTEDKTTFEIDEPLMITIEPITINILQEKREVFELNKGKDRLSIETLQEIIRTADHHAIRILSS